MNTMGDVKKKNQEWKIEVSTENGTITLVLIDKNNNPSETNIFFMK